MIFFGKSFVSIVTVQKDTGPSAQMVGNSQSHFKELDPKMDIRVTINHFEIFSGMQFTR